MTRYDPAPEDLYPCCAPRTAPVLIHPDDRKYGALLVGGQGSGKTAAMLALLPQRHPRTTTRRRS